MKINLQVIMDSVPPPSKTMAPSPSLDDRVQHASECIELGSPQEKMEATEFLKQLYLILRKIRNPRKGDLKRLDYIHSILLQYGLAGNIPTGD